MVLIRTASAWVVAVALLTSLYTGRVPAQSKGISPEALAHAKRGIQAREENRLDEAARELEVARRLAPNVPEIHAELGLVRHTQGDLAGAVESFRKALELRPDLRGVYALLGFNLLMLGQAGDALPYLKTAHEDSPGDLKLKSWLGLAYLQSGNIRESIGLLESVRESNPEDVDVLLYLAEAHTAALAELREQATRVDPERAKRVFDTPKASAESRSSSSTSASRPAITHPRPALIHEACTQCHKWSPPGILPKAAWVGKVAKMFGLANDGLLASLGRPIRRVGLDEVVKYFQQLAPAELETPPWRSSAKLAKVRLRSTSLQGVSPGDRLPGTANVRLLDLFDEVPGRELVACDMLSGWVSWANPASAQAQLRGLARLSHPAHAEAVDLDQDGRMDLLVADLGEVMPSDETKGAVVWLRQTENQQFETHRLIDRIGRVADVQAADFDADGDLDLVVAEFGWITVGRILYLENQSGAENLGALSFKAVTLDSRAGGIRVPVVDLNQDAKPDFIALISQQHEAVVAFLNQGGGRFEKREIFVAPHPHWGSSGIEAVDFDQDGDTDILLTNGDTMDDMIRFKPYQGVSWLENRGEFPFVHHLIGRYYGAMHAEAGDMDGDGDLDVVVSSWIPELKESDRSAMKLPGAVWFEQTDKASFEPHVLIDQACDIPTLDLGDVDGDGRLDVITGAAWLGTPPTDRQPAAVQIWLQQ